MEHQIMPISYPRLYYNRRIRCSIHLVVITGAKLGDGVISHFPCVIVAGTTHNLVERDGPKVWMDGHKRLSWDGMDTKICWEGIDT